jgi:hypothetical protein
MELIEPFKQFVVKIKLNEDLKNILNFCIKVKNKEKGKIISNLSKGFQSNDLNKKETVLKSLIEKIKINSNIVINDVLKTNYKLSLNNIWININKFKDFNITHKHPFSKLSGVFYVKIPKNSGDLLFVNETEIDCFVKDKDIIEYNNYNCLSRIVKIYSMQKCFSTFCSWRST